MIKCPYCFGEFAEDDLVIVNIHKEKIPEIVNNVFHEESIMNYSEFFVVSCPKCKMFLSSQKRSR